MIKEAYCSFEVSKLLKEKGFDESIFEFYVGSKDNIKYARNKEGFRLSELDSDFYYPHITHQMACAWLREKYGIFIAINNDDLDFNWQCYDLINRGSTLDPKILSESYGGFKHYEDAVEAALKYSLENLI